MPRLLRLVLALVLTLAPGDRSAAQANTLIPVPRTLAAAPGAFRLDDSTFFAITQHRDARLEGAVRRAIDRLGREVGIAIAGSIRSGSLPGSIEIRVHGPGDAIQGPDEDERYRLTVTPSRVALEAATVVGALRGLETLVQLSTPAGEGGALPAVVIDDAPRFRWRGLLLDVSRHFMSVAQVKKTIDGMARVKLNVLHWHLTDDQGFRIESKRYPRLHALGSDGLYYTQAQVRDIVAYARDRGIRVVPELDMPGHTTSWFVGYPRYSAQRPPIAIRREWGGADAIFDPTREETYTFIAGLIAELSPLFPDRYWHVGGDEVEGKHWDSNPAIVRWRRRRGISDNAALQAYFNQRLSRILTRAGKRMIGWDEILHPDLPPGTVVQSWRGTQYLADAAKRGHDALLSAPWYLDHIKSAAEYYAVEPVPQFDELTPDQKRHVLGGEAAMWAEYITEMNADSRIWPRLGAVAERLWSPREVTDVADMYRRLDVLSGRLEAAGFRVLSNPSYMLREIVRGMDVTPVESLLVAVQPAPFGQTENGRMRNQRDALRRVVDAARPDPTGRWLVERLVRRVVLSRGDVAARDSLDTLFARWIALEPVIAELGARSPALAEVVPVARALARASTIGREALGFMERGEAVPPGWAPTLSGELRGLTRVQPGSLRIAIADDVAKLVVVAAER